MVTVISFIVSVLLSGIIFFKFNNSYNKKSVLILFISAIMISLLSVFSFETFPPSMALILTISLVVLTFLLIQNKLDKKSEKDPVLDTYSPSVLTTQEWQPLDLNVEQEWNAEESLETEETIKVNNVLVEEKHSHQHPNMNYKQENAKTVAHEEETVVQLAEIDMEDELLAAREQHIQDESMKTEYQESEERTGDRSIDLEELAEIDLQEEMQVQEDDVHVRMEEYKISEISLGESDDKSQGVRD